MDVFGYIFHVLQTDQDPTCWNSNLADPLGTNLFESQWKFQDPIHGGTF